MVLQVGLEGLLCSSCSAAGMWRVRDLAGLGRDDLFSGLRYALSWMNIHHQKLNHMYVVCMYISYSYLSDIFTHSNPFISFPFTLPSLPIYVFEGIGGSMQRRGGPDRAPPPPGGSV